MSDVSIVDLSQYRGEAASLPDIVPADNDSEVQVRIIAATFGTNKNGDPYFLPTFEIVDNISAPEFTKYMGLPTGDMEPRKKAKCLRVLDNFSKCFDVDMFSNVAVEDLKGKQGWVIVGIEADETYGDKNYIKRFITGA